MIYPPAELERRLAVAVSEGYRLEVHAIGDACAAAVLDAFESVYRSAATTQEPPSKARPILTHCQVASPLTRLCSSMRTMKALRRSSQLPLHPAALFDDLPAACETDRSALPSLGARDRPHRANGAHWRGRQHPATVRSDGRPLCQAADCRGSAPDLILLAHSLAFWSTATPPPRIAARSVAARLSDVPAVN